MSVLIGHVDRVDGRAITGWLANADEPERLETVICEGANGRRLSFRVWHPREDVNGWLKRDGRFGFVIPLSTLAGLGDRVTIRDRQGAVLPNGDALPIESDRTQPKKGPVTVILHIPKTAGTSLRNSVIAGLLPSERLFVYPPPFGLAIEELACLPLAQRRAASLLIGHTHYGVGRLLGRPVRYVTFLRDPDDRLRSHVAHHAAVGTVFGWGGPPLSLADAANEGLDAEFDNLMVRSVAGLPTSVVPLGAVDESAVELALYNIERDFALVGFTETLAADTEHLAGLLGRELPLPRTENARERGAWFETIERAVDWDRVLTRNRFDRMLYDRARAMRGSAAGA